MTSMSRQYVQSSLLRLSTTTHLGLGGPLEYTEVREKNRNFPIEPQNQNQNPMMHQDGCGVRRVEVSQ